MNRAEAKRKGLVAFDGATCPHCGGTRRYVADGSCAPCKNAKTEERRRVKMDERNALKRDVHAFRHPVMVLGNPDRVGCR